LAGDVECGAKPEGCGIFPLSPVDDSSPGAAEGVDLEARELARPFFPPAEGLAESGIAGVRLTRTGQVFFFSFSGLALRPGLKVMAFMGQEQVLAEVALLLENAAFREESLQGRITGLAGLEDLARDAENRKLAEEAAAFCRTCIQQRGLDMKLVEVHVLHDRAKILFFFTAHARIDFRELVKDLVRAYRIRIELRQIGVRHETQMLGGIGNCGSVCCCHRFLRKFAPVTIKMAKEQNLFLNPAKLSGMCGRLLCCLSFEQGNYSEFNSRCPRLGKKYATSRGVLKIIRTNLFSRRIVCLSSANEEMEFSLEEWEALNPGRVEQNEQNAAAADGPGSSSPSRPGGAGLPESL
jgi:cell fate regulator YaaT (PSP1 superfamily)